MARGRPGPAPQPWVVDIFAGLAGLGFGAVLALVIAGETRFTPHARRLAHRRRTSDGICGAYLMLVMVVLIARLPWLEPR